MSRKGVLAKRNSVRARKQIATEVLTIADLDALLCLTLKRVIAGMTEPGVGNAAATIAKAILGVRQGGEIEQRLSELEARAGIGRKDWSA